VWATAARRSSPRVVKWPFIGRGRAAGSLGLSLVAAHELGGLEDVAVERPVELVTVRPGWRSSSVSSAWRRKK
jgi:hypothetical protein